MPYDKDNPPDKIKSMPKEAQSIFVAAFNSALDQYDGD
ncbi:MAG: ChaB family protein, partial [Candidatus Omnitrophica bacterium]|nr:ChaB family protein [Candidatus Omnitrophota bacterium]